MIGPATDGDRAEVEALLAAAALPLDGLEASFPGGFAVAREVGVLVGAAGIEQGEADGLLRSVVVAPSHRGRGLGDALVVDRIGWAADAPTRGRVLSSLWLVTNGAAAFFARHGFTPFDRRFLPASSQLGLPACATAVAMRRAFYHTTDEHLDAAIVAELVTAGTLVPPWQRHPDIPRRSIGWRMGSGEWYLWMWQRWWQGQDAPARQAYVATWSAHEPPSWRGWFTS